MRKPNADYTPTLAETIRTVIDANMADVHTCLPAKIVTYDRTKQMAALQIQLLRKYEDGSVVKLPTIPNVPVKWPRAAGGKAFLHMPLVPGDDMVLVFAERSLDNWKTSGGMTDPKDRRKFNLSDAYALVGGSAFPNAFTPLTADAVELVNDMGSIQVFPDGTFKLTDGIEELFALFSQMAQLCSQIANAAGPTFNAASFVALKAKIDSLKGA
jgi:hypothetical protein